MIPNMVLSSDPDIRTKMAELMRKKMCRFCLRETNDLVDIVVEDSADGNSGSTNTNWKLILRTCFATSMMISKNLPQYGCDRCCDFLKQCYQFQKLRKKAEVLMQSYILTGSWTQSLNVPEWLRPAGKRQREEEMVIDSPTDKRFCFDEVKDCQIKVKPLTNTKEMTRSSETSQVGTIRVRSIESLVVQPTRQCPEKPPASSCKVQVNQITKPEASHPTVPTEYVTLLNKTSTPNSSSARTQTLQLFSAPQNLRCKACWFQFTNPTQISFHMRKHVQRVEFLCGCGHPQINGWTAFMRHIQQNHRNSDWCYLCGKQLSDGDGKMLSHLERHLEVKLEHACDFCQLIFMSQADRMEHVRRKHSGGKELMIWRQ